MAAKRIIVIGAGVAGLTAAYRLQQAGHEVQVFESDSKVGGRMITIQWQGYTIDPGAEFITGADTYLLDLVKALDIQDKLVNYSDQQTGFYVSVMRGGEVHKVNFMSIPSYMGWKAVSLGARLSMLKLLPYMLRSGRAEVYYPENAPGDDTINMRQFFYEKISAEMFDYWVEPTFDVFCHYIPEDLSAKMLLLLFGNYLSQKLYTFQGGIGVFPEALAARLNLSLQTAVRQIELRPDGSGVTLHYTVEGQPQKTDADRVILAVPGDAVLPLCKDPRPAWQAFFPQVRYTQVGILYHLLEGDDSTLDEGGIMFPQKEPWQLAALGWKRRADGRVLAMSDLKASLYNPAISDAELRRTITAEAIRAVPAFEGRIIDQMVFRWARKVPAFPPGFLTALKTFRQDPQESPLFFCGDYLTGPNTGAALVSGWQAAERLLHAS